MFQDGQLFAHLTRRPQRRLRAAAARGPPSAAGAGRASCSRWSGSRGTATGCPATLSGGERQRVALARVAGRPAAAAAARRAALRARRRAARAARRRPARDPARGRHHRADGHPRPGGGVRRRRPARGDARPAGSCSRATSPRCGGRRPTRRPRCSSATPGCSRARRPASCSRRPGCRRGAAVAVRRSALASSPTPGRCAGDGGLGAGRRPSRSGSWSTSTASASSTPSARLDAHPGARRPGVARGRRLHGWPCHARHRRLTSDPDLLHWPACIAAPGPCSWSTPPSWASGRRRGAVRTTGR